MLEDVDRMEASPLQRPSERQPGEVAAALKALAFATSDEAAQDAYHRVSYAVGNDHRGSYFPIVLDAVPYLGEILVHGSLFARFEESNIPRIVRGEAYGTFRLERRC